MQEANFTANLHCSVSIKAKPELMISRLTPNGNCFTVDLLPDTGSYSRLTMFVTGTAQIKHLRRTMAEAVAKIDAFIAEEEQPL